MDNLGNYLIFLISQPRAGSTMVQRILGAHPDIHTTSEPWLMLAPIYALRPDPQDSPYDTQISRQGIEGFLQTLPKQKREYYAGLRRMYSYLYERALESSGKRLFLDKTPRYYSIILEIAHTFPKAKFIILFRNPLAVLNSLYDRTWKPYRNIFRPQHYYDLIKAPGLLLEAKNVLGEKCIAVHYENIVSSPETIVPKICDFLEIKYHPEMINYGEHKLPQWTLGDQAVYKKIRPTQLNVNKWLSSISKDPQLWRITYDYLQAIDPQTLTALGYPYEELLDAVKNNRPRSYALTFPLKIMLPNPREARNNNTWRLIRFLQTGELFSAQHELSIFFANIIHYLHWRQSNGIIFQAKINLIKNLLLPFARSKNNHTVRFAFEKMRRWNIHKQLKRVDLTGSNMQLSLLEEVVMKESILKSTNLRGAYMVNADLRNSNLSYSNLQGALLWNADLEGSSLISTDLRGARLGCNLTNADLRNADFQFAQLTNACLIGANLEGAINLSNTELARAKNLRYAIMPNGKRYDGRYQLMDDLLDAQQFGADPNNPTEMALFYRIPETRYMKGLSGDKMPL